MAKDFQVNNRFRHALLYVLANEGTKFTNDPADPGRATRFGITLSATASYPPTAHFTAEDIRKMTLEQAAEIYYHVYWEVFKDIENERIQIKCFDIYVNMPPKSAIKIIQRAANNCRIGTIAVDGVLGRNTLKAINSCNPEFLMEELVKGLNGYYNLLVTKRPVLSRFIKGWLKRADKVPAHV